jgi:type IV pilus assembly protein PilA
VAIPAYQDYLARAKISMALSDGNLAAAAVADHFARGGTVPRNLAEAGVAPPLREHGVRSMNIDQNGVIRIVLNFAPLEDKTIALVPSLDSNKRVIWKCVGQDIQPRYLPQGCKSRKAVTAPSQ